MRRLIGSAILAVAGLGLTSQAAIAAPLIAAQSTYSIYLESALEESAFLVNPTFDDVAQTATWRGLRLVFNELETDLGNGVTKISLQILANGDLFPQQFDEFIYAIGAFDDPLDLSRGVALLDARVSFFDVDNLLLVDSGNLIDTVEQSNPWDGYFPASGFANGIDGIGGMGITGITFDFLVREEVAAVPEPGSVLLAGLGIMAMVAVRRRRRR